MPTYTYMCKKCSGTHDVFHAISASPKVKCPLCGAACKKMFGTGAGIIFKGSGFYETDYKKRSNSGSSSAGNSESKKETKTETKTESTPAKKAAAAD